MISANSVMFLGAGHLDELMYLFGMKFYNFMKEEPIKRGTKDYQIMEQMVELWTNFAQTGYVKSIFNSLIYTKILIL